MVVKLDLEEGNYNFRAYIVNQVIVKNDMVSIFQLYHVATSSADMFSISASLTDSNSGQQIEVKVPATAAALMSDSLILKMVGDYEAEVTEAKMTGQPKPLDEELDKLKRPFMAARVGSTPTKKDRRIGQEEISTKTKTIIIALPKRIKLKPDHFNLNPNTLTKKCHVFRQQVFLDDGTPVLNARREQVYEQAFIVRWTCILEGSEAQLKKSPKAKDPGDYLRSVLTKSFHGMEI